MSVSVDYAKQARFEAFADMLDFLSRPQEVKALVEEMRTETAKNREVVEAATKVNEVDAFVKKADADIAEKYEVLERAQDQLQARETALAALERTKFQQMSAADEALRTKQVRTDELLLEAEDIRKQADVIFEKARKQEEEAKRVLQDYTKLRDELAAKQEALAKVLGS